MGPGETQAAGQSPIEVTGRPQGGLSGKTVYVSAGHGWQWNGYAWRTQRPPYPDASTGYSGPIIEDHNNAEVVNQYLLRYLWNAGADMYKSSDGVRWYPVTVTGLGDVGNYGFRTMESVGDDLYVGTTNPYDGLEIWRATAR